MTPPSPPPLRDAQPRADDPAEPLALTWGDLSELWVSLTLHPTRANRPILAQITARFHDAFGESLTLDDVMSMYDNAANFEEHFNVNDRMVLTGMTYVGLINTRFGPAKKVLIDVCTRESYPKSVQYSAIGEGFAALAQNATPDDFPHVAQYVRVRLPSGNEVKRFAPVPDLPEGREGCSAWIKGDDGGPVNIEHADVETPGDIMPDGGTRNVGF